MKPDESLFHQHIQEPRFLAGVDAEKWALHGNAADIGWPTAILWVQAHVSVLSAKRLFLRFNLDGYPVQAPTSCPWDTERNQRLDCTLWPKVSGTVAKVFRTDWNGAVALYAPCDRLAMSGHEQWKQQFPHWWWQSQFTVTRYLEFVHRCLNPKEITDE